MKAIFVTDLHGNKLLYDKLFDTAIREEVDAIIFGGDLCPHFSDIKVGIPMQRKFLITLMEKISKLDKEVFIIMGNDDFRINMDVLYEAEDEGLVKVIHKKEHKIGKHIIIGYSFVNETPFLLKDWEKLDTKYSSPKNRAEILTVPKENGTIEDDLKQFNKEGIYVFHAPPYNTNLDIIETGEHVGSKAIKKFIERVQPILTLHGHIHESVRCGFWNQKINKTIAINPGSSYPQPRLNYVMLNLANLELSFMIK